MVLRRSIFFNDTATTEIYTLSLHDALPISRTKIRQWFTKERRDDAVEAGKEALTRAMRKAGLPLQRLLGGDALATLAKDLRYADVPALYAAVGENQLSEIGRASCRERA